MNKQDIKKLEKVKSLNAKLKSLEFIDQEWQELHNEYMPLQTELVEKYLPLVNMLAEAGLLSFHFEDQEQEYLNRDIGTLGIDAERAYKNGIIYLYGEEVSMHADTDKRQNERRLKEKQDLRLAN